MPPVALLAHGAGSSPDAVVRLLGPAFGPGVRLVPVPARGSVDDTVAALATAHARHRGDVVAAGGISMGAQAVALWALEAPGGLDVVLALPAWTGQPGPLAALTTSTAEEIERSGSAGVLARLRASGDHADDWVLDELEQAWSGYDDAALAAALRAAAASRGPTLEQLAALTARTAVVGLREDPLHPEQVAREWAAALPRAALALVDRHAPQRDRGALGAAARQALDRLSGSR